MTSTEAALGTLWGLAGMTFLFVALRLYTRLVLLQSYGVDDYFYNAAFLLFVTFNIMLTVAAQYGFGKDIGTITSQDDLIHAILYEAIGQTVMVVGTVVSKASLGLFLMRLVVDRKQMIALAAPSVILALFVVVSLLVFWFSCRPISFLWNRFIPGGRCDIDAGPISTAAGVWSVIVDFWYAGFPWYLIWKLQMPRREKIVIGASMSLGILAGACGIKRALELGSLSSPNYTKDTVDLNIWHAAELAVTMVCIGIPVCRPAYQPVLYKLGLSTQKSSHAAGSYKRRSMEDSDGVFGLHTIGGTAFTDQNRLGQRGGGSATQSHDPEAGTSAVPSNASDELILGPDYRSHPSVRVARGQARKETEMDDNTIWVETKLEVTSSAAR